MNATLSLALIVKDVEATIDKCLSSIKNSVDEIIVVDTGSTDKTIEIVKKYTDKIFYFKWIDDFSAARNYSFEKCTGTHILWLDGDDYVTPENAEKIRNLDYSDKEIIISNYEYARDEFGNVISNVPRERIVKRSLGLKWEDPIHEFLPLNGKIWVSDITVCHNKQHNTSDRNIKLLETIVNKKGTSRHFFYLGKEYYDIGDYVKAIKYFSTFVKMKDSYWEDVYIAYYKLALCYFMQNNDSKFLENIFESLKIECRWPEPFYYLGLFYMNKGNYDKAIFWYETCLNIKRPKDLLVSFDPSFGTYMPALNLCLCYNNIGDIKKAYEYNKIVLKYRPQDSIALNNDSILSKIINEKKDGKGKKLNLGCGGKREEGYINCDIFEGPTVDEIFEFDVIPYMDNSIGGIASEHSLEHVPFARVEKALKEWFRVLMPGGELLLKMPEFEDCCRKYVETPASNKLFRTWYKKTIYGNQSSLSGEPDDAQIHRSGFSQAEMQELLEQIGFTIDYNVRYDGWDTPSMGIRALKPISSIKIGWVCAPNWDFGPVRIRVLNVDRWLRSKGYKSKVIDMQEAPNYDIIIIGKGFDEIIFNNILELKKSDKLIYADMCEDILDYPWVKEILKLCDKVICCSRVLAEKINKFNKNTLIIEDAWES